MYHIGKVLKVLKEDGKEVISADSTVQALIETWDENRFTFMVDQPIAEKIKVADIAVVDYRPQFPAAGVVPQQKIVKILRGKIAKEVWDNYREYFCRKKEEREKVTQQHEGMSPYAR